MPEANTVVPYDIGVVPEAAVSGARLLQTEHDSVLFFNALRKTENERRLDAGVAVVTIEHCLLTKFGYPNDEALSGHPLYGRGLRYFDVFEVLNSSWIRQISEQNRVSFPKWAGWDVRHWVFTFHDSTFECIATGLKVEIFAKPFQKVFADVSSRLFRKGGD